MSKDFLARFSAKRQDKADFLQNWQQLLQQTQQKSTQIRHGFTLGEWQLLLPKNQIGTVIDAPLFCPLPGTPSWLLGMVHYRGYLVVVYDVLALLSKKINATKVLIIGTGKQAAGLVIETNPKLLSAVDLHMVTMSPALFVKLPSLFQQAETLYYQHANAQEQWLEPNYSILFKTLAKQAIQ